MIASNEASAIQPDVSGTATADEARRFRELVLKHGPLPEGVSHVSFRFEDEPAESPAVWIEFHVTGEMASAKETRASIRRLADLIRADVWASGADRWPYVVVEAD